MCVYLTQNDNPTSFSTLQRIFGNVSRAKAFLADLKFRSLEDGPPQGPMMPPMDFVSPTSSVFFLTSQRVAHKIKTRMPSRTVLSCCV